MIGLMLVDDEERARHGIRTLIDWETHGIRICGEARDGEEALQLLKNVHADILMTDIRMPVMDGLELIERVAEQYPSVRRIIMSGYDDFGYARKALAFGACEYLLKPSRTQEILEAVLKQAEAVREERNREELSEQLAAGFRESFPLLKERTLSRLILSSSPPYERLLSNLRLNGVAFPYHLFGVLVLEIDNFHSLQQRYSSEDIELFKYALKNIAEETLTPKLHCATFEHEDHIVVIVNTGELADSADLILWAETLQANVASHLKFSASVGIGSLEPGVAHLHVSYKQAIAALERRYFTGAEKIVTYLAAEGDEPDQTSYPLAEEKAILHAVAAGDGEETILRLEEFNRALKPESTSKEHVLKSALALVFALYRFCIERNINTSEVFGKDLTRLSSIMSHSSLEAITVSLADFLNKIRGQLDEKKNSNKLLQAAVDFMKQNYRKDISRETVAREVFITPGYLSLLFKQELKTSFVECLHQIRTEKAAGLLKDRSLRISDIAYEVGYNDEKYFFQVFKKYTGMTPSQYRNML